MTSKNNTPILEMNFKDFYLPMDDNIYIRSNNDLIGYEIPNTAYTGTNDAADDESDNLNDIHLPGTIGTNKCDCNIQLDGNDCWEGNINNCKIVNTCANNYNSNCIINKKGINEANQKKIWKSVGVNSSMYTNNKAGLFTFQHASPIYCGVNWNQMSDRAKPSITYNNVPSHGNSTKRTLTRHRPGAGSAPGIGVDVKHGSYQRYLLRKKGKCPYKTEGNGVYPAIEGNKTKKYGIAYSNQCKTY